MEPEAPSFVVLYLTSGVGFCMGLGLLLYNLVVLIGFLREPSDEAASGLSKAAWGVGVLALFLGPCGWIAALAALILARIETGRIYQEQSSIRSATPARMGSVNGGVILFLYLFVTLGTAVNFLF